MEYLEKVNEAYNAMAGFRQTRARLLRYAYGDQWGDTAADGSGLMSERNRMTESGRKPLSVNLIRRMVRTLVARFRNEYGEKYDTTAGSVAERNHLLELDCRLFEEFIISGCAIQRVSDECRPAGSGIWVDNIDPNRFFVNKFRDQRGSDITFIGMFHDLTLPQLVNRFAGGSGTRAARLEKLFENYKNRLDAPGSYSLLSGDEGSMFSEVDDKMRVVELWVYEATAEKKHRGRYGMEWRVKYIAPSGEVLSSRASGYGHKGHPFVLKLYPFVNGEVHSYVEDLIECQRSFNILLTTFHDTLASSAKGVLLFPINHIVKGMTMVELGRLWAKPDSVIPINGNASGEPKQLITNANSSGIVQLVDMQLKIFNEASGMSDALLGKGVQGNVDAESRNQLIRNAALAVADLIDAFASFLEQRAPRLEK